MDIHVKNSSKKVDIHVKVPGNRSITLSKITYKTKIRDIKHSLFKLEGFPQESQILICNGRHLNYEKKLSDYENLEKVPTIYLSLRVLGGRSEEELQVYVQTSAGVVFLVTGVFLVEQVKDFVLSKTLIPISAQRLTFGGVVLKDHTLLKTYGIVNGDMLEVLDTRVRD